jgi:uncharacterized heparinase superfamily protein
MNRSLSQVLARVSRMSAREVAVRAAQELDKRLDEAGLSRPPQPAREAAAAGRFFFDDGEAPRLARTLRERMPEQAEAILEQAEKICRRRFDLLGYVDLDFGKEIDWRLDPVHGVRAPECAWRRVPFLDFAAVGDHKIVWELSRCQHLATLARAHLLSGAGRYLAEIVAQWYAWQEHNRYPTGINWASSLEVAFRSLAWIWTLRLLGDAAPDNFRRDMTAALGRNAWYIERYLSTYFAPNTHLLGEGLALFFIGTLCPEFAAAPRWRRKGWAIVNEEARRQVLADGMHFEQSTYYHVYALDMFLHARVLAARNGAAIPEEFDSAIVRMAAALRLQSQGGAAPRFGDDDGGRLFDPRRNRTEHLLDPLATCAVIYGRGDFAAAACGPREETLWLLGTAEGPAETRAAASGSCPEGGAYCLAAGGRTVVIDAGPLGALSAGHGHADALSLQWIAGGRHWLTDPGTYCYPREKPERDRYRGTAAHNTLEVDGLSQADPAGPFSWGAKPRTRVERWETGGEVETFAGSHDGYERLAEPVTHRRTVRSWNTGELAVRDEAVGRGVHDLAVNWHLGPGFRVVEHERGRAVFEGPEGQRLIATAELPAGWSSEVVEGEWSPAYGAKAAAPVLRYYARTPLPAAIEVRFRPPQIR